MGYVIDSAGTPLPEDALRRLVEVVDGCRGADGGVFVVFRNKYPYEAISVHDNADDAEVQSKAEAGLSFFGPVVPSDPPEFYAIKKTAGTSFIQYDRPVYRVVLYDKQDKKVDELELNPKGGLTNPRTDVEALLFTPSSVDKYAIPYVTRVYGVDYAAKRRKEWLGK
jgi:hypothetical protein